MKISEELIDAFVSAHNGVPGESSWILAVALQQAVAENLEMKFEATNHCITAERKGDGVTAYRTNFDDNDPRHKYSKMRWIVEANTLLKGEK